MASAPRFVLILAVGAIGGLGAACQESRPRDVGDMAPPPPATPADSAEVARLNALAASSGPNGPNVVANPLISRDKAVFASGTARAGAVNDGVYRTFAGTWNAGAATAAQPTWAAMKLGAGPARVFVVWSAGGNYNYTDTEYGSPGSYRIETSADSTNGADGTWKTAATNANCTVRAQGHAIPFVGQSWVRFTITGLPPKSPNGVQLDEIEAYDITAGESDSWFFFGDSITALAFDRQSPDHQPTFSELIHAKHAAFFPAQINGGIGGDTSALALSHVDAWLALNPDMRFWAIGLGTNDAAGNSADTGSFRANLGTIVSKIKAAGHTPILAKIPFSSDGGHANIPKFNDVIADLTTQNGLPPGPDLYGWFSAHPDELRDGIHPTDAGIRSMNRLWAEAVAGFYVR